MNDTDVRISKEEYLRLCKIELAHQTLLLDREAEREAYDRLFAHRLKEGKFTGILQTRDVLNCYVENHVTANVAYTPVLGEPRQIHFQLRDLDRSRMCFVEPTGPERREIRSYVETTTRINGMPVFVEVAPGDAPSIRPEARPLV